MTPTDDKDKQPPLDPLAGSAPAEPAKSSGGDIGRVADATPPAKEPKAAAEKPHRARESVKVGEIVLVKMSDDEKRPAIVVATNPDSDTVNVQLFLDGTDKGRGASPNELRQGVAFRRDVEFGDDHGQWSKK